MQRIERRDFWLVVLLTFVTCGIYLYYFIYKTTQEFNQMAGDDGETIDPAMALILTLITCGIYVFWWYYKMGNRLQALANKNNVYVTEDGSTYLLWMIVGTVICGIGSFIAQYLYLKNFNNLVDAYNAHLNPPGGTYPPPPPTGGGGGGPYEPPSTAPPQQSTQPPQPAESWVAPAAPAAPPSTLSHDPFMPAPGTPVSTDTARTETKSPTVEDSFAQLLASVETPVVTPPESEPATDATDDVAQPPTIPAPPDLPPVE